MTQKSFLRKKKILLIFAAILSVCVRNGHPLTHSRQTSAKKQRKEEQKIPWALDRLYISRPRYAYNFSKIFFVFFFFLPMFVVIRYRGRFECLPFLHGYYNTLFSTMCRKLRFSGIFPTSIEFLDVIFWWKFDQKNSKEFLKGVPEFWHFKKILLHICIK